MSGHVINTSVQQCHRPGCLSFLLIFFICNVELENVFVSYCRINICGLRPICQHNLNILLCLYKVQRDYLDPHVEEIHLNLSLFQCNYVIKIRHVRRNLTSLAIRVLLLCAGLVSVRVLGLTSASDMSSVSHKPNLAAGHTPQNRA